MELFFQDSLAIHNEFCIVIEVKTKSKVWYTFYHSGHIWVLTFIHHGNTI